MTETMLVRAADGAWEELRARTEMPDGGIIELFGEDIGPVLGTPAPVIVAACAPQLPTGSPDAIGVDPDGVIWIIQMALDGGGEMTLPQLLACAGGLTGMSYDDFEVLCERCAAKGLAPFVESQAGSAGFHLQSFEVAIADSLANGRFRLAAFVREAAPALIQSMRFLNASGASGALYEATSFASDSVTALRCRTIDIGGSVVVAPQPAAASVAGDAAPAPAAAVATPPKVDFGAAGFVAATGKQSGDDTSALMAQLQKSCLANFDEVTYDNASGDGHMHAAIAGDDGPIVMVDAATDGSVVVSFEVLGPVDPGWTARTELCQGMERLLGADLGDVRKISQLNLSIDEHLMDATLMEALGELLGDTVEALRESRANRAARAAKTAAA